MFAPRAVRARACWDDARTFANFEQHDVNEAFQALLHSCDACDLHDFLNLQLVSEIAPHSTYTYTTPYWNIFGSRAHETTRCASCPHVSEGPVMQTSFSLSVPLQGIHTVERLFADALGHEPIHGNCPHCQSMNSRTKTTELINKPRVLVLHLKRWDFIRELRRAEKINTTVSYETVFPLDVANVYELCSVVVHHGAVGGGHYTAFVRAADRLWYHCNDAAPPRACSEEVLNATAYMLFYQRL